MSEEQAAGSLFSLLPEDLAERTRGLWDEYEEAKTEEARFARAMDRLQGFAQNVFAGGRVWRESDVVEAQVREHEIEEGIACDPSLAGAFERLYQRARESVGCRERRPDALSARGALWLGAEKYGQPAPVKIVLRVLKRGERRRFEAGFVFERR